MATQTETQRKAAAQKAAATRRRNAARRSRSATKAAETRARAQASSLKSFGWRAQRVADTAVGAAVTAGEKIAVTAKPLRSEAEVRRRISRLQREATTNLRKSERRGASARRRVTRTLQRQRDQGLRRFKRNRREAERRAKSTVKSTKDELAQRADGAQSAADELGRRVRSEASGIV